jgi:RecA/RadA recombinase
MSKKTETETGSIDSLKSFLKQNEEHHYNYEEDIDYKVSCGSLKVDFELGGGLGPGLHRFVGINEGGKTSEALEVAKNFLKMPKAKAVYIKAEGRLSGEVRERSGIKFVSKEDEWEQGSCFVFECNIYETVLDLMRVLIARTPEAIKYCFILDSLDGLIMKDDLKKNFEDSHKVAGGALLGAKFMQKMSIALAKRGHMAIFISQVRADIKLDPYSKAPVRQTTATGGNALLHFANYILEFEPRFKKDLILENPSAPLDHDKNKIIGHVAKITVKKSPNEKTNYVLEYPIKYGRKNGTSIWVEKELIDMLYLWGYINKKGAWISVEEDFVNLLKKEGYEFPPKLHGEPKLNELLEASPDLIQFLIKHFSEIIYQQKQNAI